MGDGVAGALLVCYPVEASLRFLSDTGMLLLKCLARICVVRVLAVRVLARRVVSGCHVLLVRGGLIWSVEDSK